MEVQKTDETVENESEERLLSKLFKFDHEINYNDELSESEEVSIEEEDDDVALQQEFYLRLIFIILKLSYIQMHMLIKSYITHSQAYHSLLNNIQKSTRHIFHKSYHPWDTIERGRQNYDTDVMTMAVFK